MKQALKKLFGRRWFAVTLCVVCVIASTLLNTRVGLGGKSDDVIDRFYDTRLGDNCISTQLMNLCKATTGLTAIAGHYNLDSADANRSSEQLEAALKDSNGKVRALYGYYTSLLEDAEALIARLEPVSMSKRDAENYELYSTAISSAQSAVEASDYNTRVQDFLRVNSRFPAGGLAAFAGVRMPELFR